MKSVRVITAAAALCIIAALLSLPSLAANGTMKGSGSAADPYQIEDYKDLKEFASRVNGGENGAWAVLTKDITANDKTWTPIGNYRHGYSGTFDGKGHTITNLNNGDSSDEFVGLFSYIISNGTVQNVGLINASIKGRNNVGSIAGNNEGNIKYCYNTGSVSGDLDVGGIVGYNGTGTIQNCYNTGSVSGNQNIGGIAGYNVHIVKNCYNTGSVSGNYHTGGIAGFCESGSVQNCCNTGEVRGSYGTGGVIGYNDGTVKNCYYLEDQASRAVGKNHEEYNDFDTHELDENFNEIIVHHHDPIYVAPIINVSALSREGFSDRNSFLQWDDFGNSWYMTVSMPDLWTTGMNGSGTENSPYEFSSADHWNALCRMIENGGITAGMYIRQTAGISVSAMAGCDSNKAFRGVYDGGGHTLTFSYTTSEGDCAPFRYIRNATIKTFIPTAR